MGCNHLDYLRPAVGQGIDRPSATKPRGTINPLVLAHAGLFPQGRILMLGASPEALALAAQGIPVSIFEENGSQVAHLRAQAHDSDVLLDVQHLAASKWPSLLGFERWAGIVALFPEWSTALRRRLVGAVPSALKPGGAFLFEAFAESPTETGAHEVHAIDPDDFLLDIDVMHLAGFSTEKRTVRDVAGKTRNTHVFQVIATHPEPTASY